MTEPGSDTVDPVDVSGFAVSWDQQTIHGISRITPLLWSAEVIEHRDGDDAGTTRKSPGRISCPAVTLERELTRDTAFERWANEIWQFDANGGMPSETASVRKEVAIELSDQAGHVVWAYQLHRCWVSEYEVFSTLDAEASAKVVERIRVETEGWTRVV